MKHDKISTESNTQLANIAQQLVNEDAPFVLYDNKTWGMRKFESIDRWTYLYSRDEQGNVVVYSNYRVYK